MGNGAFGLTPPSHGPSLGVLTQFRRRVPTGVILSEAKNLSEPWFAAENSGKKKPKIVVEKRKFDQLLGKLIETEPAPKESIKAERKKPHKIVPARD